MQHSCRVLALFGKAVRELGIQKRGGEKHRGLPKSSLMSEGECSKMGGEHTGVTVGTCSRGGVGMLCMLSKTLTICVSRGRGEEMVGLEENQTLRRVILTICEASGTIPLPPKDQSTETSQQNPPFHSTYAAAVFSPGPIVVICLLIT